MAFALEWVRERCYPALRRRETILLHFAPECDFADLECFRRGLSIATKAFERTLNRGSFLRTKVQIVVRDTLAVLL